MPLFHCREINGRRRGIGLLAATTLGVFSCTSSPAEEEIVHVVSLVNLIATPSQYDERWVTVQGYFKVYVDSAAIFLTRDHWVHGSATNSIGLRNDAIPDEQWRSADGKWVTVRGRFDADAGFGPFRGTILEIDHLVVPLRVEQGAGSD